MRNGRELCKAVHLVQRKLINDARHFNNISLLKIIIPIRIEVRAVVSIWIADKDASPRLSAANARVYYCECQSIVGVAYDSRRYGHERNNRDSVIIV